MEKEASFDLLIVSPEGVIYEGKAHSVLLPGEKGVFEIAPYHKRLLSRLLTGKIFVDGHALRIRRGVAKVGLDGAVVLVESDHSGDAAA